jgi:hypothetical protein
MGILSSPIVMKYLLLYPSGGGRLPLKDNKKNGVTRGRYYFFLMATMLHIYTVFHVPLFHWRQPTTPNY